jgi:hypothetical protein
MDGSRLFDFSINQAGHGAALAARALACTPSAGNAQGVTIMIAVESMRVGAPPEDFDFGRTGQGGPGQWIVVADTTATGGRAIEQSSTERTDYRFPLAIHRPLSARNVDVALRFKAVAGNVDRAAGIVVRLTDPDNYYVARANALEDNVRFYRVVKGRREQIKGTDLKVSAQAWHTLGLKAEGDRFTVMFDGKELYTASDNTMAGAGKVALWTKSDSVTRFDRIEIKTLP